jgi:hypothetical protein
MIEFLHYFFMIILSLSLSLSLVHIVDDNDIIIRVRNQAKWFEKRSLGHIDLATIRFD